MQDAGHTSILVFLTVGLGADSLVFCKSDSFPCTDPDNRDPWHGALAALGFPALAQVPGRGCGRLLCMELWEYLRRQCLGKNNKKAG